MMKLKPSIPYIGLKRPHCKMEMETLSTKGAEIDQDLNSKHTVCVEIEGRNSQNFSVLGYVSVHAYVVAVHSRNRQRVCTMLGD